MQALHFHFIIVSDKGIDMLIILVLDVDDLSVIWFER